MLRQVVVLMLVRLQNDPRSLTKVGTVYAGEHGPMLFDAGCVTALWISYMGWGP
jgi:hypothetical protein